MERVSRWIDRRLGPGSGAREAIIMAERISWLGCRPKPLHFSNDCVVVNFNSACVAAYIMDRLNQYPENYEGIHVRPLGFFYPPPLAGHFVSRVVEPNSRARKAPMSSGFIKPLLSSWGRNFCGPPPLSTCPIPSVDLNSID